MHRNRRAIGVFAHRRDAEAALMELRDSGFPMNQVSLIAKDSGDRLYSDRFNRGDYLVMIDGTDEQIHRAEAILKRRGIADFDIFDATDIDRTHHATPVTEPELGVEEPKVIIIDRRDETFK
ncbi:hypothetical protein CEN47_19845 [Fischerella thermalis CCMEE 5319]|nr:hypothetical protein CEN47_19845 [Fischerella thermalis CCMEE 5319]